MDGGGGCFLVVFVFPVDREKFLEEKSMEQTEREKEMAMENI